MADASLSDLTSVLNSNFSPAADVQRAQVPLIQQQVAEAQMRNRILGLQLSYQQQLPAALAASMNGGNAAPTQSGDSSPFADVTAADPGSNEAASGLAPTGGAEGLDLNPAATLVHMRQQFAPVPTGIYSPQEQQAMAMGALSGNPGAADLVKAQHQMRLDAINQTRATQARSEYNTLAGIATAPDGRAMDMLELTDPIHAQRLQQAGATDEQVRRWAAQMAGALHVGAQMDVEYRKDGTAVDKQTQREIPGYDAAVGLGPDERVKLTQSATEPVDTFVNGVAAKLPRWKAEGTSSPDDWIQKHAQMASTLNAGLQSSATSAPPTAPVAAPAGYGPAGQFFASGRPPVLPSAVPPQSATQVGPRGPQAAPGAQAPSPQPAPDPVLARALADPDYKLQTPKVPNGQALSPAQTDQQKATVGARTELQKDSQDATASAAQSMQYLKAAQAIMQSKGAPTVGLYGPIMNEISRAFGGGVNATNYQEVAKYLGNAALSSAKQTYGNRMTQSEVGLQLNELSPSTKMTDDAINNLLATNLKSAQYTIDTARRVRPYLVTGGDPQNFAEWNEKHYSRAQIVNGGPTQPANSPGGSAPISVTTRAQAMALKPGTQFRTPDGRVLVR